MTARAISIRKHITAHEREFVVDVLLVCADVIGNGKRTWDYEEVVSGPFEIARHAVGAPKWIGSIAEACSFAVARELLSDDHAAFRQRRDGTSSATEREVLDQRIVLLEAAALVEEGALP